jgi:cytochrome c oxidase assembly protein Cox11
VLEVVFTTLLVLVTLLAGAFAALTLYKLFSGQA